MLCYLLTGRYRYKEINPSQIDKFLPDMEYIVKGVAIYSTVWTIYCVWRVAEKAILDTEHVVEPKFSN